eukprot:TRINITY_DN72374_c0_g1_i1.p1 TRINITY_DN72374_c0_g1~~TRINITY_DN72374_c0_g1_i1.p1  ORF type:complete len:331 (+),score=38.98 TRINITY_DN72374_c0_g1_i1:60-1052(+)
MISVAVRRTRAPTYLSKLRQPCSLATLVCRLRRDSWFWRRCVTSALLGASCIVSKTTFSGRAIECEPDENTVKADLLRAGREGDVQRVMQLLPFIDGGIEAPLTPIGETILGVACAAGNLPLVCALLDAGADPKVADSRGATCLLLACAAGHAHIARRLLKEVGSSVANAADMYGTAPLHRAVGFGHVSCVEALLEHGADVNLPTSAVTVPEEYGAGVSRQETPLHIAVRLPTHWDAWPRRRELINLLISHGADPLSKDSRGDTPLHFCARYQDAWTFYALLSTLRNVRHGLQAVNNAQVSVSAEVDTVRGRIRWIAWAASVANLLRQQH